MCLVVALCILLITIVRNGKEVLVGASLVRLVFATIELGVVGVEGQLAAIDNLVSILDSLLQTSIVLRECRVCLRAGNSSNLVCCQWVVTPYKIGTCQQSLGSLL